MLSVQASERALLCYLMNRLNSLDPDVLVGHNVSAFDLDILLHRLQHHKVKYAGGFLMAIQCFVVGLQPCVCDSHDRYVCHALKQRGVTCISALMVYD